MRILEGFVNNPLAGAAGWALLHSLWQGAMVAAALAAALLAVRSARVRYASACLALLAMLGGFGFTLVRGIPESLHAARNSGAPVTAAWRVRSAPDAAHSGHGGLAAVAPWLAPFWMAGVAAFYLRQAVGCMAVRRMRRRGVCAAAERWQREVARWSARLRLTRPVMLAESCLADAPMVLGHFRPLILMPIGVLAGLPAGQIEAVLLHELAHIRRHDYLVNAVQRLVEGLLFYHPAVWWISGVIRSERENCCDDAVVAIRGEVREYAEALESLEQNRCCWSEAAVAATGGSLVKRIHRMLYPRGPHGSWTPLLAALILMASAAVALAAWQTEAPTQSRYKKWLNEYVAYIIEDAERAAFERLSSDADRDKFVAQFWERRNPTLGASTNKFKEEHYRRMAYANEHFASAVPGWKTDRGRIYIVYGPPDEIEVYPRTAQNPPGIEIWAYRHVEGGGTRSFTFLDRAGNGDYRLAPGNAGPDR
jgi:GWxTD domain-containing protein